VHVAVAKQLIDYVILRMDQSKRVYTMWCVSQAKKKSIMAKTTWQQRGQVHC